MAKRLNVLLLQADQLAAAFLPAYGNRVVKSPNIDALSEKGVTFDSFYCASPLCAPSRFTMMAGAHVSRIGAYDNAAEFASEVPTFAHYMRAAGYSSAGRTSCTGSRSGSPPTSTPPISAGPRTGSSRVCGRAGTTTWAR
jgi:arylsulfatase A-like enzyme